jgi:hypothetical protein
LYLETAGCLATSERWFLGVPSRFSGNWQVDVTHVAEGYGEEAAEVA